MPLLIPILLEIIGEYIILLDIYLTWISVAISLVHQRAFENEKDPNSSKRLDGTHYLPTQPF